MYSPVKDDIPSHFVREPDSINDRLRLFRYTLTYGEGTRDPCRPIENAPDIPSRIVREHEIQNSLSPYHRYTLTYSEGTRSRGAAVRDAQIYPHV